MFAKLLLPTLGGAPVVWIVGATTFQAAVLLGYLYAHALARVRSLNVQIGVHVALLALAGALLPPALRGASVVAPDRPLLWACWQITAGVGPVIVILSATAPLLSSWFARTTHSAARDPYVLYAASNAGSLVGLFLFPLVLEPRLTVTGQAWAFTVGYAAFVALALTCALRARPSALAALAPPALATSEPATPGSPARWLFLSFVPCSLYLGFTTWVTTDLAAIPLLWVIPLAVYLASFVIAFARRPPRSGGVALAAHAPLLFAVGIVTLLGRREVSATTVAVHLAALVVGCVVSLRELAASRPDPARQTEFFVWIAVGGILGGVFNAILAPRLFTSPIEYPLALVLTVLCRPRAPSSRSSAALGTLGVLLPPAFLITLLELSRRHASSTALAIAATAGALLFLLGASRRALLTSGVAALYLAASLRAHGLKDTLFVERTFYGIHRVRHDGDLHVLLHGDTQHGIQDTARPGEPLGYHARTSPVGGLLASPRVIPRVAVVGLGAGVLAAYGRPGQSMTFFELDPLVVTIARNPTFFSYLADSQATIDVVLGDARGSLAASTAPPFDVIVLDAFSSDAIPVHLVTREAIAVYLAHLAPGGLLVFNVSNRYIRLAPILAALARDLGLAAWRATDVDVPPAERRAGKLPSEWVVLARAPADLAAFSPSPTWRALTAPSSVRAWTDHFSNLFDALGAP